MIKNIVFDFGGVILKHKPNIMELFVQEMFSIPYELAYSEYDKYRYKLLVGEMTQDSYLLYLKSKFHSDTSIEQLLMTWRKLYEAEAKFMFIAKGIFTINLI
jgi:FMN phosphatase YigB (HAD superfamily)